MTKTVKVRCARIDGDLVTLEDLADDTHCYMVHQGSFDRMDFAPRVGLIFSLTIARTGMGGLTPRHRAILAELRWDQSGKANKIYPIAVGMVGPVAEGT